MKIVKKTKKVANQLTHLLTFQNTLALLLTLFIVSDINPNMYIANFLSSSLGYFVLFVSFLLLIPNVHPIILFIYLIFCYELINRSLTVTQKKYMKFMPGESTRTKFMEKTNFFPETLEENVINEKVPPINYNEPNSYEFKDNDDSNIQYSKI